MSSTKHPQHRTQNYPTDDSWGPEQAGLRIQIWTDQFEYHWGQDIWLHVAIENCGQEEMLVRSTSSFQNGTHRSPLYSMSYLRVRNHWQDATNHTWDLYPVPSSMYKTLELTKLPPGDRLVEKSQLNSGLWSQDGNINPSYPLPVGECLLQAECSIDLTSPRFQVKQSVIEQLPVPLWTGTTFSNPWSLTIGRKP